ncbi:hypothetical protein [Actinomadura sp. SCN-SB]|uniref:hypothetical protein n=1 Tax=Actinomadura sp. SCN-SB TaxID=3373092 RepID=UPI003753983C
MESTSIVEPTTVPEPDRCRWCGRREDEPMHVVSRHLTSTGLIVYARCRCGLLRVWQIPLSAGAAALLAHAAHPAEPHR